jgi:hypothetical protein
MLKSSLGRRHSVVVQILLCSSLTEFSLRMVDQTVKQGPSKVLLLHITVPGIYCYRASAEKMRTRRFTEQASFSKVGSLTNRGHNKFCIQH